MAASVPVPQLTPDDLSNRELLANVHPADWTNPTPARRYNLVVLGAGTAGLVAAAGAAGLGAKVALIEPHLMGGDCLNYGCVPSKALVRAARAAAAVRDARAFGVDVPAGGRVDFPAVMERMRRLRAGLSAHDSAHRFKQLGIDVFIGRARFTGPDRVEVGGATLCFKRACIATGARAAALPIPGLDQAGYLTNETVFSLTALPRRLAVIGAGPIGCELSQAFCRFGSEVTLLELGPHILLREDHDAARRVEAAMLRDGVRLEMNSSILSAARHGHEKILRLESDDGAERTLSVDEILVGGGRVPNVAGLGLEAAGVRYDAAQGVRVDDRMRTSNPLIYAAGDVASPFKFTHVSDATARIVIRNALFFGRARLSALTIPWCTYTDPEIAHVGLYEAEARARGIAVTTFEQELREVDRAVLDGADEGFIKVHLRAGSDRIIGATIVAGHAGEMISELTLAITHGLGLGAITGVIHPYPTQAEAIKKLADSYNRTRLTPAVKWIFEHLMAWRRRS